jgi:hypothetical protein
LPESRSGKSNIGENVIRATFGNVSEVDPGHLIDLTGYDEHAITDLSELSISRAELLKLAVLMIVRMRDHLAEAHDTYDSIQSWGWFTACEFLMTVSEQMPDVDLHGMVEKLRVQVHTAMSADDEIIAILERTRDSLHEIGDPLAARDDIDRVLAIMRGQS